MTRRTARLTVTVAALGLLAACSSVYYSALEKVGIEKRDILVDRVESVRDAQTEAQEQFKDALEQFKALVGYGGGDLEAMYNTLSGEYEASQGQAQTVRDRVAAVKEVAGALFREWEGELAQYSDPNLRRQSQRQLNDTRARYNQLASAMDRAAASMDPVLATLHDQTLFLKHNLNARALGSLSRTADDLQADVSRLVKQMQAAIAEANRFIATIQTDSGS
jgi:ElaB/YqjD/DUF883 family membrane-anchored ribosome-binding protein